MRDKWPQFGLKALLIVMGCFSVALAFVKAAPTLAMIVMAFAWWFALLISSGFVARRLAASNRSWADAVLPLWVVLSITALVASVPLLLLLVFRLFKLANVYLNG